MPAPKFDPSWKAKPFNHKGYLGNRWRIMRERWLRVNPKCADCGSVGEEVHHLVPRAIAPERRFDFKNLCTLCRRCHAERHFHDAEDR